MTKRILSAVFAGMLLLGACSSDDGTADPDPIDTTTADGSGQSTDTSGSDDTSGDVGEATGRLAEVKVQLTDAGIDCSGEPETPESDGSEEFGIEGPIETLDCGVVDNTKLKVRQWASPESMEKGVARNMSARCARAGAEIYYVTDGSIDYTANSPKDDVDKALLQRIADTVGGELTNAC